MKSEIHLIPTEANDKAKLALVLGQDQVVVSAAPGPDGSWVIILGTATGMAGKMLPPNVPKKDVPILASLG